MKSLTGWKVYEYTTNSGVKRTVVVGFDTTNNKGIIEEVYAKGDGTINDYTLFGEHNNYFAGAQELWTNYCTQHDVNSIKDVSDQY